MRGLDVNNSLAETQTQTESNPKIDNLDITIEEEEILTFHEEGQVERETTERTQQPLAQLKDLEDVISNDVKGFLQRPIHFADFVWKASEPDAVELIRPIHLPRDWINQEMIAEKLNGFRYVKCDFKVRVQVNAQPFNAGYLLLTYIPLFEQQQRTPSSLSSFCGITGYRRALLDLSEDTSAELQIPFSGIINAFDLIDGYGMLGSVKLYIYSPLTGLDNVDGTVWLTASDVEVFLPTGLPIDARGPAHAGVAARTKKDQNLRTTKPVAKKGRISSIADTVSDVAGALVDVPVIGSVASTVEWVSDAVSSVASFFGFSKPIDKRVPNKQTLMVGNNFANYDGDAKAKSLAFFSENETRIPTQVFGTEKDEMSFSHILAQPTYLERFKMRTTDAQRAVIWKWPVDPRSCRKIIYNDATKTPYVKDGYVCENTYLSYLSNFFKYWRGTIKYHFRIIKTCFHSGRIRVFVVPGANASTKIDEIDFNKVHSIVYDIRDTTSFDLEVPYKWITPWKTVDAKFNRLDTDVRNVTPNEPTAMVYVQVINSLRNPSTAADHIDFVVETSAGDDFQFAFPMVNSDVELVTTEEALRIDFPATSGPAHAGSILDNAGGKQMVANEIAIGEVVTGWRTILKRYANWLTSEKSGGKQVLSAYQTLSSVDKVKSDFDLYSACELLYRFKSGSLRVGSKSLSKGSECEVVNHELAPHNSLNVDAKTTAVQLQSETLEPLVELAIPFYQETVALPTCVGYLAQSAVSKDTYYRRVPFNLGTLVRSTKATEWWRATGEDFSFGYLIGPPKTICYHATQECQDDWRKTLDQLLDANFYPTEAASADNWAKALMKLNTVVLEKISFTGIIPQLATIRDAAFNDQRYQYYIESKTPMEAVVNLNVANKEVYDQALPLLQRICLPPNGL